MYSILIILIKNHNNIINLRTWANIYFYFVERIYEIWNLNIKSQSKFRNWYTFYSRKTQPMHYQVSLRLEELPYQSSTFPV